MIKCAVKQGKHMISTNKIIEGIQLGAASLFAAFSLVAALHYYTMTVKVDQLTTDLNTAQTTISKQQSDNEQMALIILSLVDEVQLRQDITSLIVDAARAYNIDPKLLANLIKSESNFRPNIKHSVPHVECMAGINNKAHPKTLYNPSSITGCVYAAAEILAKYIDESDGLTLALTKYKGFSPLGHTQAKAVIKETYK